MAGIGKRTYLREVNPHLICPLCRGYLIDATTVVECLHSFCRSCILKHLNKNAQCPTCKHLLNTAKPNIKADKALQDIVYKLVPGLYHKEMRKRREFYSKHPEHADSATPEQRGEDVTGRLIFAPEDAISLSLEYLPMGADPLTLLSNNSDIDTSLGNSPKAKINGGVANRRYLQCPALVTIAHLKKFLALKYSVDVTRYNIDICHRRAPLPEHWTLMDVAYIFAWKRNAPIRFFYRITQEEQQLEAPPNERPSTPGLGASQPIANEQAVEPENKKPESNEEPINKSDMKSKQKVVEPRTPQISPHKPEIKRREPEKIQGFLAKRSAPAPKENLPVTPKTLPPLLPKPEPQVKTPIKIMKNSDGRYQVLRGSTASLKTTDNSDTVSTPKPSPTPSTPAEFSVVSIADGVNSNSVKITLKQCSPGSTTPNNTSSSNASKKPKVISNVLLRNANPVDKSNPASIVEQLQEQKQKRKVTFLDTVETSPASTPKQVKKSTEQVDKKQFLQSFRLTAAAAKQQQNQEVLNSEQTSSKSKKSEPISVEEQVRSIITKNDPNKLLNSANQQTTANNSEESSPTKKRQNEGKINSTNIADRLGDPKKLVSSAENASQAQAISSSNEQPIDVYAFPNDPPAPVLAGAVKRKCPPGLPIFEMRKKQQYQGKRGGSNATRGGAPVKCYRNQSAKPIVYAKPPASPLKIQPVQNLHSVGNVPNVNTTSPPQPSNNPAISSTSPKNTSSSSPVMISNDTRNLLDGCGLNIPASLSITLTAPKSPSRANDPSIDSRGSKEGQNPLDKLNPSITLNDKSVDPRVLKALKSGQMRMPRGAKAKLPPAPEQASQQTAPAKRKKEEQQQQQQLQQAKSILDLSGTKKMDIHPLRIPTPVGKFKPKPPTWSQANNSKPPTKDDTPSYTANGQVVTLTGGQRFYRAPPGSLTPAAHRISDIPSPSRGPVYAPCFSSPAPPISRPPPANLSSVFPSLQSLYALSQAPSLEQFHMDSRMRMAAAANAVANASKDSHNGSSNNSALAGQKSHLAAQCAPIKPARSSIGSFAVPIAKQTGGVASKLPSSNSPGKGAPSSPVLTARDSEMTASSTDSGCTEMKSRKSENFKEASSKTDTEQSETCASSTEEGNSQQGAASPRVTSTASPSPPPSVSEATAATSNSSSSESKSSKPENRKQQPSSGSEVTSSNKSPESPDSSSVITEGISNLVDSTKPAIEKVGDASPPKAETKATNNKKSSDEAKSKETLESAEFKKPMSSETLQKRFLDAFPSNEWANDPIAAEQFGNFLKRLSSMQAEAQSKNTKAIE